MPKNIDRTTFDESYDLTPSKVQSIFKSANSGNVQKQCRLANELTEKDPAISQAWSVRVSAIASCPWEIVGEDLEKAERVNSILSRIQPQYDSGLVSFNKLLQYLQSAVLQGFSVAETFYENGGSNIEGFKLYSQSLFSFTDSDLPLYVDKTANTKRPLEYPRWIYHTATNARESEPLRSGIVRPLAYLYSMRRHFQIQWSRGAEKYGIPMPVVKVDEFLYEDSEKRQELEQALLDWTYDGHMVIQDSGGGNIDIQFPTASAGFDKDIFQSYLEFSEKQIFRIILGQDSTSSADNSNRSTAQVHNLVRGDMLASDAIAVQATVNDQIIKPLCMAIYGNTDNMPVFKFRLKGVSEMKEYADLAKTLKESGFEIQPDELSMRMGIDVTKIVNIENNEGDLND